MARSSARKRTSNIIYRAQQGFMELPGKSLNFSAATAASELTAALLPIPALTEEGPGFKPSSERAPSGPIRFLNLAAYVITDSLLSETQEFKIYEWLKAQNFVDSVANAFSCSLPILEGPTGEALQETSLVLLFRDGTSQW